MNHQLKSIKTENDLEQYRAFLNEDAKIPKPIERRKRMTPPSNSKYELLGESPHLNISSFLKQFIGKPMRLEFIIDGKAQLKQGILQEVNEDYLLLRNPHTLLKTACTLDKLCFVTPLIK